MGKFRFVFTISLTVLHVVAFIGLLLLFSLSGLEWGVYFGISFLAIAVAVFVSAGIIIWQWKANETEQRSFPVLLPHFTVVMVYDLAVLALILVGWLLHPVNLYFFTGYIIYSIRLHVYCRRWFRFIYPRTGSKSSPRHIAP